MRGFGKAGNGALPVVSPVVTSATLRHRWRAVGRSGHRCDRGCEGAEVTARAGADRAGERGARRTLIVRGRAGPPVLGVRAQDQSATVRCPTSSDPGTSPSCSTATGAGPARRASATSTPVTGWARRRSRTCWRWCDEAGRRGRHAVPAVHRQPDPPGGRAGAAAGDHRRRRRRAGRAGRTVAAARRGRARPAARDDGPAAVRRGRPDPEPVGHAAQRRGRLRRPAGDRGRGAQAAAPARRDRHVDRGARRGPRRRPHRGAPLHIRPARSRPGHPHLGRAASLGFPAVAVRALGVLVLRGVLAGVPESRLPAGAARLRRPAPRFGS